MTSIIRRSLFVTGEARRSSETLPTVLARLAANQPIEFRNLQAHQTHAWHAFLVQLAALALHRGGESTLPQDEARWHELLLGLTDGAEEPWCLVVDDVSKPAFMQPPLPAGEDLEAWKNESTTPEAIDVLVTAKNHDVKRERFTAPEPDDWIYALVTLQTMQGFSGRDNYGAARMNGGFASRPGISVVPGLDWSSAFRRDVELLLHRRGALLDSWEFEDDGVALLWLQPWDGLESLRIQELDPFFIEICRRVRLTQADDSLRIRWTSTRVSRVNAKDLNGNLGDLWTPIKTKGLSALTVSERGLDYRLVVDLMFNVERFEPSAAQSLDDDLGETPHFLGRVLVRGQGKTGGYHERWVPIPGPVAEAASDAAEWRRIALEAEARVEKVATAQRKVLRPALLALHQGGSDDLNFKDDADRTYLSRLDREVDRTFFDDLFRDEMAGLTPEELSDRWDRRLYELAKGLLDEAIDAMPCPDERRYRAIAAAEARFYGGVRKHLPGAHEPEGAQDAA